MVVYIDILFILNLFVNYFIILAAEKLCRTPAKFIRRILSAALGAAFSFSIFFDMGFVLLVLIRFVCAAAMVFVAFGFNNIKLFLRLVASMLCVSFLYAGIMMALWLLFKPSGMAINNGVVYFNISPAVLIVSTLVSYAALQLIRKFVRHPPAENGYYDIKIALGDSTAALKALLDTGHALSDLFSDAPVIVAEYGAVKGIIPAGAHDYFLYKTGEDNIPMPLKSRIRLIPFKSVGGDGVLPAFVCDMAEVKFKGQVSAVSKAIIAVSPSALGDGYSALISNDLINSGSEADVGISGANVTVEGKNNKIVDKAGTAKRNILHKRPGGAASAAERRGGKGDSLTL